MTTPYILSVIGLLVVGCAAAPVPKEKPMLKCELKFTGKIDGIPLPDGGEVAITNNTSEVVDIGSTLGPRA